MKDLRKSKVEIGPDVKVFTDHIPTSTEQVITKTKKLLISYYLYAITFAIACLLAKYPEPVGRFVGSWWYSLSTAFVEQQKNI